MSTRTHIVLVDGLLDRVDEVRGDVPRSKWIQRLIEERLDASRRPAVVETRPAGPLDHVVPVTQKRAEAPTPEDIERLHRAQQFYCPVTGCEFTARSPKAICQKHGRMVR